MSELYIKVDGRFYAEHADGTAYLTTSRADAMRFSSRRTARIVAASVPGAAAHVEPFDGTRVFEDNSST